LIQVELSAAEIPIEPGGTAQLTVTVLNKQAHDDHVFLEIEGIDVEWYALPVPAVNIPADECQSARVLFKIARSSECHAGTYPFLVRARGMESGESGVQQAVLIIKPFSALQIELNPRRTSSTFLRHATAVEIMVSNLGNREETLHLYASDPEDGCAYEFETDRIAVKPGHSATVPLLIEPVTRPILGATRLYGYTVTARSVDDSYVSATANGQLERHALLAPLTAIIFLLIALGAGGYALFRPKPVPAPVIRAFTAVPTQVMAGDVVTLSWDVRNLGVGSLIQPDNIPIKDPVGSVKMQPTQTTRYTLVARNGSHEKTQSIEIVVKARPPAPKPRITQFTATQTRIHVGDTITLSWKVEGADRIVLNPVDTQERDARLYKSRELKPDHTTTYVLAVQGRGGDVAQKSLKVEVVPDNVSIAEIKSFRAKPESIEVGQKATLSWVVTNATSITIDNGVGSNLNPVGRSYVSPLQTTIYTLTATDNKGNTTTRTVTVTVTQPEPPQNPEEISPDTNPSNDTPPSRTTP